ncbi:hypothetical protein [Paenibacillus sp. FSL H8-0034]|uniref:hypothetical protein n=1 Tax=Paenibacillus sp. FSL H8-0034 TaxID=2954671 RepID=UPI0030F7DE6C
MKKVVGILLIVLVVLGCWSTYEYNKPILTNEQAISSAKRYLNTVNEKKKINIKTESPVELIYLNKNSFWDKATGNRTWEIVIDGVAVYLEADTGQFIQLIFPLDGIIMKADYPDWFK